MTAGRSRSDEGSLSSLSPNTGTHVSHFLVILSSHIRQGARLEIRRHHHRFWTIRRASLERARRPRLVRRADRRKFPRRHLHQHRMHSDENHGAPRARRALRSQRRPLGRAHAERHRGPSRNRRRRKTKWYSAFATARRSRSPLARRCISTAGTRASPARTPSA